VVRTHRTLVDAALVQSRARDHDRTTRVALTFPASFLGAAQTTLAVFSAGGCVCVVDPAHLGPAELFDELRARSITEFTTVPSVLRAVVHHARRQHVALPDVRVVGFGGEPALGADLARARLVFPNATFLNVYGTQESGGMLSYRVRPDDDGVIPAGRPAPDVRIVIVDEGAEVRDGDVGELVAFGARVSATYWNDADATTRGQIELDGEIGLRTGDLARHRPDGNVEIVGRVDDRVKIGGRAVDLLEVEAALAALPDVDAAAVTTVGDAATGVRLVAHVVPARGVTVQPATIRQELSSRLPEVAIPRIIHEATALPLTLRGKVDRNALRDATPPVVPHGRGGAPRTRLERQVRVRFADLLGLPAEELGIDDDFFELGGDSLGATELIEGLATQFLLTDTSRAELAATMLRDATVKALAHTMMFGAADRIDATVRGVSVLSLFASAETGVRLFCQPGGGRGVLSLRLLADELTAGALVTFWPRGFRDPQWPHRSIRSWAAAAIRAMRVVQPDGPYHLTGHSFGGVVAYEMARQLRAAGAVVNSLTLVEADAEWRPRRPGGGRTRRDVGMVPVTRDRTTIGSVVRRALQRFLPSAVIAFDRDANRRFDALEHHCRHLLRRHRPGRYGGRVVVVRADDDPVSRDALGWDRFVTGELEVVAIPGNHMSVLRAPHVRDLAATLDRVLAAAETAAPAEVPDVACDDMAGWSGT
jgi:thioesterase domain-containing protein